MINRARVRVVPSYLSTWPRRAKDAAETMRRAGVVRSSKAAFPPSPIVDGLLLDDELVRDILVLAAMRSDEDLIIEDDNGQLWYVTTTRPSTHTLVEEIPSFFEQALVVENQALKDCLQRITEVLLTNNKDPDKIAELADAAARIGYQGPGAERPPAKTYRTIAEAMASLSPDAGATTLMIAPGNYPEPPPPPKKRTKGTRR